MRLFRAERDGDRDHAADAREDHAAPAAPSRRRLLQTGGLAALGATGAFGIDRNAGPGHAHSAPAAYDSPAAGTPGRIDVHHHAVPPAMRSWAVDNGLLPPQGGPRWANWSLSSTLEAMDANRIAVGVASAPIPPEAFRDKAKAATGIRICNESLAELVRDRPTRFGFFAYLPLLHVDLALEQISYGLDELGADGVIMMTSAGNRYLGHRDFDPVFAELDRRRAVVFTHPGPLPDGETRLPGLSSSAIDFLFDTTRAALSLITSGTLERYRNLSVILSHAGGFLPYAAGRIKLHGENGEGPDPAVFQAGLRRFYYDTALPASPTATPSLLATVDPRHVLYGTDWPQRPADQVAAVTADLDRDPALDGRVRRNVNRANALRLLPRLAARLGARPGRPGRPGR